MQNLIKIDKHTDKVALTKKLVMATLKKTIEFVLLIIMNKVYWIKHIEKKINKLCENDLLSHIESEVN